MRSGPQKAMLRRCGIDPHQGPTGQERDPTRRELGWGNNMRTRARLLAVIGLLTFVGTSLPAYAGKGTVRVTFAKAGFIAGFGSGSGVLTFHGKRYPFDVSGLSWGATVGISTNQLVGTVLNLDKPEDFAGSYAATGGGIAAAAGVSRVRLQNAKGVVLVLQGAKFGVEISASYANVTVTMR